MAYVSSFSDNTLEHLAKILAEYATGSQLTDLFSQIRVTEASSATKWRRIKDVFRYIQNRDQCGNHVITFIQLIADPVRFVDNHSGFDSMIEKLNSVLIFSGIKINEQGKAATTSQAHSLNEARQRASTLRNTLHQRNIHGDVIRFCKPELLQENYFHAVLESTKSVSEKLRQISGLTKDGNALVLEIFDEQRPIVAINSLRTPSELSEQKGFKNLLLGVFSMFRNTTAHEPKINWIIEEQDAIDLLTTISFIHRKLDKAVKIPVYAVHA